MGPPRKRQRTSGAAHRDDLVWTGRVGHRYDQLEALDSADRAVAQPNLEMRDGRLVHGPKRSVAAPDAQPVLHRRQSAGTAATTIFVPSTVTVSVENDTGAGTTATIPTVPSEPPFPTDLTVPSVPPFPTQSQPTVPAVPQTVTQTVSSPQAPSSVPADVPAPPPQLPAAPSVASPNPVPPLSITTSDSAGLLSSTSQSAPATTTTSTSSSSRTSLRPPYGTLGPNNSSTTATSAALLSPSSTLTTFAGATFYSNSSTTLEFSSAASSSTTAAAAGFLPPGAPGAGAGTGSPGQDGPGSSGGGGGGNSSTTTTPGPVIAGAVTGSVGAAAVLLIIIYLLLRWWRTRPTRHAVLSGDDSVANLHAAGGNGPSMSQRPAFFPVGAAALMNRKSRESRASSATLPTGQRSFQKIAGRKMPSQFDDKAYEGPMSRDFEKERQRQTQSTLSETSFYRDSYLSGISAGEGPSNHYDPTAKETLMPSPARTPVIHSAGGFAQDFANPPSTSRSTLSPPQTSYTFDTFGTSGTLGRSHQDGSRGSKFTEEV